jgi:CHRD domain
VIKGRARQWAIAVAIGTAVAAVAAGTAAVASSGNEGNSLHEDLVGFNETPAALSTTGHGTFDIQIDENAQTISWELSYADLEGSVLQAHIHFGSVSQTGGISLFLCTNLGNGPAGTQACPAAPATISGTLRPGDVIGPAAAGISAGQFDEVLAAIRAGFTYVNVHSDKYPGGEIRAQLGH